MDESLTFDLRGSYPSSFTMMSGYLLFGADIVSEVRKWKPKTDGTLSLLEKIAKILIVLLFPLFHDFE
jgi:hypothetical protein